MSAKYTSRNIGLDLIRVTETAALAAGHWLGSGDRSAAHRAATRAMASALDTLDMDGRIVIGEDREMNGRSLLSSGQKVGAGEGPEVDLAVDPIDGTNLLIKGRPGAISVVGITPRGTLWSPIPAAYMEKIIVDQEAAHALVPECLDAPAAWTLALVARVKGKGVRDLTVIVLDRPRNEPLIEEIRDTGAHLRRPLPQRPRNRRAHAAQRRRRRRRGVGLIGAGNRGGHFDGNWRGAARRAGRLRRQSHERGHAGPPGATDKRRTARN